MEFKLMTVRRESPSGDKVIVDTVIDLLIDIDCDGETMEFILRKVGMEYQMLRQLMMTMPLEQVEYLLEERKDFDIKQQTK